VGLAAVIVASLALAVSTWSVLDSRASARRSASAAERSATASEQSAISSDRSATAAERSAAADERQIELATTYRDPWRLEHESRSAYLLVNDSNEIAEDATLTSGSWGSQSSIIVQTQQPQNVRPQSAIRFVVARDMSAADEQLTVTWRRPGEDTPRTWRHPLPSPPKR
jgi:hypothetical protein